MDEVNRKDLAFYYARTTGRSRTLDARKLHESFKDNSEVALKIILDDWNDPAAIGRQLKILVDDLWADIDE